MRRDDWNLGFCSALKDHVHPNVCNEVHVQISNLGQTADWVSYWARDGTKGWLKKGSKVIIRASAAKGHSYRVIQQEQAMGVEEQLAISNPATMGLSLGGVKIFRSAKWRALRIRNSVIKNPGGLVKSWAWSVPITITEALGKIYFKFKNASVCTKASFRTRL